MTGNDRAVLAVNSTTRIMADDLQWIVQTRKKSAWTSRAYVGGTKATLLRVLGEMRRVPTARGQKALDNLPDTFQAWKAKHRKKRKT